MITWTEFLERLKGFTWYLDNGWVRIMIGSIRTCPVCAAAGNAGQLYWRTDLEVVGMLQSDLACIADAEESSMKNHTELRSQLLKACNLAT